MSLPGMRFALEMKARRCSDVEEALTLILALKTHKCGFNQDHEENSYLFYCTDLQNS